jgi:hypothetical protein
MSFMAVVNPKRKKDMKQTAIYFLSLLLFIASIAGASSDIIPDAKLRVTVRDKIDGKINKGLTVLELSCWNNQCSLSSVSLNNCMEDSSGKKVFYPSVQYSATWLGNLKVRNVRESLIVEERGNDVFGSYVNNFQFSYTPVGKDKMINRLIGFSGGSVKNSALLKKVLTIDYVPLPKRNQVIKLDCGVLLPGVDKK